MSEWLIEDGIGEQRALLVENDRAIAAKLRWPGELHAGQIVEARLVSKASGSRRGLAQSTDGQSILVDRLPKEATEGQNAKVQISRAAIAERGRYKLAQGRVVADDAKGADAQRDIFTTGKRIARFPAGLWEDVWDTAASGEVHFANGSLLLSVTPAMTLIDIDGDLPPRQLALAAVQPLADTLRQMDLGGSIGIDFPTLDKKSDRKEVDQALEQALSAWPHERTAMNGFGFVHCIARLEGPSLLHRMASSRTGAVARMALRRAEMVNGPGTTLMTVHPALKAKLKPEWLAELERRTGRPHKVETDPGLAIEAAQAQIIPHD